MRYDQLPEKDLLRKCIEGNGEARDAFVEKYSERIYASIYWTLEKYAPGRLREDVEDLHNTVFLSLFKDDCHKLRQYRGDNNCSVASWLTTVSVNAAINFISRTKTHVSLDNPQGEGPAPIEGMSDSRPSVVDQLINAEELRTFQELLRELKPDEKMILRYFYEWGISREEIGRIMNISEHSVYSKISRIKKRLQESYKKRRGAQ